MRGTASARWRALWGLALAAALGLAPAALAQTDVTTGRIAGTVSASDGSPLPGVSVEAKNQETGLIKTTTTDSSGGFVVRTSTGVPPSARVRASAPSRYAAAPGSGGKSRDAMITERRVERDTVGPLTPWSATAG